MAFRYSAAAESGHTESDDGWTIAPQEGPLAPLPGVLEEASQMVKAASSRGECQSTCTAAPSVGTSIEPAFEDLCCLAVLPHLKPELCCHSRPGACMGDRALMLTSTEGPPTPPHGRIGGRILRITLKYVKMSVEM